MVIPTAESVRTILLPLTQQRDDLIRQLQGIEGKIEAVLQGKLPSATTGSAPAKKRFPLKRRMIEILKREGDQGTTVKNATAELNIPKQRVHVWLATTGRKLGVKKNGLGNYCLN